MPLTRTVPRGRRTTRPGASTTLRRPPSRRRRSARFRKGQALKTIRRDSPRRPPLRHRPLRARSRRRLSGSSLETISRTRSAPATGAPRARRLRPSTPRATFAGVGRRRRPDRGGARRPLATGTRRRRRPRSLAIRAPARHWTRPRPRRPRRGRDDHRLGRGGLRRTGERVARRAIAPLAVCFGRRRASPNPARRSPRLPRRRIPLACSPISTRRRRDIASCAKNGSG